MSEKVERDLNPIRSQSQNSEQRQGPVLADLFRRMKTETPYTELIKDFEREVDRLSLAPNTETRYSDTTLRWLLYGANAPPFAADREYLKTKLKDSILVDLGGGQGATAKEIARAYEASAGINVDKFIGGIELNPLKDLNAESIAKYGNNAQTNPECALVAADMLDFVSRLPDNSINFMANGIDAYIIGLDHEYNAALAKEIVRAMKPGGVLFGNSFEGIWYELTGDVSPLDVTEQYKKLGLAEHPNYASEVWGIGPRIFEKSALPA